jgi:hypothetical protein
MNRLFRGLVGALCATVLLSTIVTTSAEATGEIPYDDFIGLEAWCIDGELHVFRWVNGVLVGAELGGSCAVDVAEAPEPAGSALAAVPAPANTGHGIEPSAAPAALSVALVAASLALLTAARRLSGRGGRAS